MRPSATPKLLIKPVALGFKQLEEERRNLSERISNGQGKAPSSGPRGFIIGTFVQGSHDRHRLSSDTGPRTMYRVYRSGITADSAMDTSTLEKTLGRFRPRFRFDRPMSAGARPYCKEVEQSTEQHRQQPLRVPLPGSPR